MDADGTGRATAEFEDTVTVTVDGTVEQLLRFVDWMAEAGVHPLTRASDSSRGWWHGTFPARHRSRLEAYFAG